MCSNLLHILISKRKTMHLHVRNEPLKTRVVRIFPEMKIAAVSNDVVRSFHRAVQQPIDVKPHDPVFKTKRYVCPSSDWELFIARAPHLRGRLRRHSEGHKSGPGN